MLYGFEMRNERRSLLASLMSGNGERRILAGMVSLDRAIVWRKYFFGGSSGVLYILSGRDNQHVRCYLYIYVVNRSSSKSHGTGSRTRQLANSSPRLLDQHEDYILSRLTNTTWGIESINICCWYIIFKQRNLPAFQYHQKPPVSTTATPPRCASLQPKLDA